MPMKKKVCCLPISSKSERSDQDSKALMGMGACHVAARMAASVGLLKDPVAPVFEPALDVPNGGVLFALPALLAMGLLKNNRALFYPAQRVLRAG